MDGNYENNMNFTNNLAVVVVVVSFQKRRSEGCQSLIQVGLIYNRWRHHLPTPPQFRHGTGGEGNILQPTAPVFFSAFTYKTFGLTDLTRTCSVCIRRVFDGIVIELRPSNPVSDALTSRLPIIWFNPVMKVPSYI
ncbi:uncharacterized protein TNCV_4787951 [Trichonephila clavipes]|nr:uncharacterized protein TNCV_4787951 [Trichonephila clavipes]